MYNRILAAFDVSPDFPDDFLERTTRFAQMTGGTVYLLHVGRGHVVVYDINAGSGLGVLDGEDDVAAGEQKIVQDAVDQLAAAGIPVHGEFIKATEHDIADVILQRANELGADIIILGHPHHRGSTVAEQVIRRHPRCSVLLESSTTTGVTTSIPTTVVHAADKTMIDPAGQGPAVVPAVRRRSAMKSPQAYRCSRWSVRGQCRHRTLSEKGTRLRGRWSRSSRRSGNGYGERFTGEPPPVQWGRGSAVASLVRPAMER